MMAKRNDAVSNKSIENTDTPRDLTLNLTHTDIESEYSSSDESDLKDLERVLILNDAKKLKVLATAFLHPELSVSVDCTATACCYFDRNSTVEQEYFDFAEEKAQILVDAAALKKLAVDHSHTEIGVTAVDVTACGRNYFSRTSAIKHEDIVDTEERAQVLPDAAFLYKIVGIMLIPSLDLMPPILQCLHVVISSEHLL